MSIKTEQEFTKELQSKLSAAELEINEIAEDLHEAEALAADRKKLLRLAGVALEILQDHHCSGMEEGHTEVMELVNAVTREIAEELGDD